MRLLRSTMPPAPGTQTIDDEQMAALEHRSAKANPDLAKEGPAATQRAARNDQQRNAADQGRN